MEFATMSDRSFFADECYRLNLAVAYLGGVREAALLSGIAEDDLRQMSDGKWAPGNDRIDALVAAIDQKASDLKAAAALLRTYKA
jgi:hypothetical protein